MAYFALLTNYDAEWGRAMRSSHRMRKFVQKLLLKRGIWACKLNRFEREIASIYYSTGLFRFLQIGAFDGVSHDNFYWLVQRFGGQGTLVEPLSDVFERLQLNIEWLPDVHAVQAAVHPTAKTLKLYRVPTILPEGVPCGRKAARPWTGIGYWHRGFLLNV